MKLLRIWRKRRRTVRKGMGSYTVRHRNVIPRPGTVLTDSPTYEHCYFRPYDPTTRALLTARDRREDELNALARADAGDSDGAQEAVYEYERMKASGYPR